MTALHARRTTDPSDHGEEDLTTLLQKGQEDARRLFQHVCLLERRLRLGADAADLLQIVHAIKFTGEDLQALFQSVAQAVAVVSAHREGR